MSDKPYKMTQCLLVKDNGNSTTTEHIAWIPSSKAKVGNRVEIKEYKGTWEIMACYSVQSSDVLIEGETDYKRHRKATDI